MRLKILITTAIFLSGLYGFVYINEQTEEKPNNNFVKKAMTMPTSKSQKNLRSIHEFDLDKIDREISDLRSKNRFREPLLTCAARFGNKDLVEYFLVQGGDVDEKSHFSATPLIRAAQEGHLEVVKLLVENGADVNYVSKHITNPKALDLAIVHGHTEVIKYLIDHKADIDFSGTKTVLIRAVSHKYLEIIKILIAKGVNVNQEDNNGNYPIQVAIREFTIFSKDNPSPSNTSKQASDIDIEMVKILFENGADSSTTTKDGKPFYILEKKFQKEDMHPDLLNDIEIKIIKILLENEADPFTTTKDGKSLQDILEKKFQKEDIHPDYIEKKQQILELLKKYEKVEKDKEG